jgi:hypothetical protein
MSSKENRVSCVHECVEYNLEAIYLDCGTFKIAFDLAGYCASRGQNHTLIKYPDEREVLRENVLVWSEGYWTAANKVRVDCINAVCFPLMHNTNNEHFLILVAMKDSKKAYLSRFGKPPKGDAVNYHSFASLKMQMDVERCSAMGNGVSVFAKPASRSFANSVSGKVSHKDVLVNCLEQIFGPIGQGDTIEDNAATQVKKTSKKWSKSVRVNLPVQPNISRVPVSEGKKTNPNKSRKDLKPPKQNMYVPTFLLIFVHPKL